MRKALITGITGQDGACLAEFRLEKSYEVHGIQRRAASSKAARTEETYQLPNHGERPVFLHSADMADANSLIRVIQEVQPQEVYN
jgi:GDPmannose 4,6-dehydratase